MGTSLPSPLELDLGEVGWPEERSRFAIRLEAPRLQALLDETGQAHRVHELMLLTRVGDLLEYLDVRPLHLPPSLRQRRPDLGASVPFGHWEAMFLHHGDDGEPVDDAWLGQRRAAPLTGWLGEAFAAVRDRQQALRDSDDPLLCHLARSVDDGRHPFCWLPRAEAVRRSRSAPFLAAPPATPFHARLASLLQEPAIESVFFYGDTDPRVLRLLATEQRRRATASGRRPAAALVARAMANGAGVDNEAWDSALVFQMEGIGLPTDLCIVGHPRLLEHWRENAGWVPRAAVLCRKEGPAPLGWALVERGADWWLYRPSAQFGV